MKNKGLDHNAMYYRGLGNLTYNEVMERKYRNLRTTITTLVLMSAIAITILVIQGMIGYETEYARGFNVGFVLAGWLFGCGVTACCHICANDRLDFRLRELE